MRIGIIAALPGELKPLVRGWEKHATTAHVGIWRTLRNGDELIAVSSGMGAGAATRSFSAAESFGALDMVLSVGWAGSLDSGLRVAQCYIPSEIIDSQTGERFLLTTSSRILRIVTTPHVAGKSEKRRLWQSYTAALVDMEAATIARLAQMRGIPICCFKAISDGPHARLPDLNPFIDEQGQMRMLPFVLHAAVRPSLWKPLMQLGRNSAAAAEAIAAKVNRFLVEKDLDRTNRTGAV